MASTPDETSAIPPQLPPVPKHQSNSTFSSFVGSGSLRMMAHGLLTPSVSAPPPASAPAQQAAASENSSEEKEKKTEKKEEKKEKK